MRYATILYSSALVLTLTAPAFTEECKINPAAIGTSRTIAVNPAELNHVGTLQYPDTLPLNDHEIVLSFDDGPIPPHTTEVLDTLASQCVKATFFLTGENTRDSPQLARRILDDGHSIGTGTQTHAHLAAMTLPQAEKDIDQGITSVATAIGGKQNLAPFFRAPYLDTTTAIDEYLASRGLMLWSIDFQADDWMDISPDEVVKRAITAIEEKKKGILLLYDIQTSTATALPKLLQELQQRGYHIVHVVAVQPKTPNVAAQ
jgi:peptidoglycan/xylan/chitin deacetylase (PgdA/CDA1 family)